MKKFLVFIVIATSFLMFSGCDFIRGRSEIDELAFISTVGIDKSHKDINNYKMTLPIKSLKATRGSAQRKVQIISEEGNTLFEIGRKMTTYLEKNLFWGHVKFIVIGEEAAKDDIVKVFDFFMRNNQLGFNMKLLVVKDGTAEEAISKCKTNEYFFSERLEGIQKRSDRNAISGEVELLQFAKAADSNNVAAYIPCIKLVNKIQRDTDSSSIKDIELNGYALFKRVNNQFHFLDIITDEDARAFNFVRNKIKSGVLVVRNFEDSPISLEIVSSKTIIIPEFKDDKLSVLIKVDLKSNMAEAITKENDINDEAYKHFEKQQEEIVKSQIKDIIKLAQGYNTDIFGIGSIIYHKHPVKWQKIKGTFEKEFENIPFDVEVKSTINRTYEIKQPSGSKVGDN